MHAAACAAANCAAGGLFWVAPACMPVFWVLMSECGSRSYTANYKDMICAVWLAALFWYRECTFGSLHKRK